ncbi:MAG: general secretion pathway protein GspD [Bacteroidetes bacterium CG12_big_fil_rev_8_21_14_0_65_60_17]|nr:MAG: general secretion pathway protein GspD [Bacteroidetes bacterium CG12_big_fil_rev_8_21_14_0_65_60_17]
MRKIAAYILILLTTMSMTSFRSAEAQDVAQRQIRTYIPPEHLVSFLPSTPFDTFIEFLNPIFKRATGKEVIDTESRTEPIGLSISGMHFMDALELVLQQNGMTFRETDRYFLISEAPEDAPIRGNESLMAEATGPRTENAQASILAGLDTRQIEINAILFEVNHTKAKQSGIDWSVILGSTGANAAATGGGASGGEGSENSLSVSLKTKELFSSFDDVLETPDKINFSDLNRLFRVAEAEGIGETVANPSVTVQSGVEGDLQIGSDVPIQIRDFSGNTVTELFKTGIIVNVTPTLIQEALADTLGSPVMDFIHLDVEVEKSGSRPSAAGAIIDRSKATTQVVLLDGEQTIIGGLYSTDETISRSGVPILKDLPGWFFGLKYVFGKSQKQITQKELVIAIQVRLVDPIRTRMARMNADNLLEERRQSVQDALRRFNEGVEQKVDKGKMGEGSRN